MLKLLLKAFGLAAIVVMAAACAAVAQETGTTPAPAPTGWVALLQSILPLVLSATGLGGLVPFVAPFFRIIQAIRDRHQLQASDAGFSSLAREIEDGIGFVAADKGLSVVGTDRAWDVAEHVSQDLVDKLKLTRDQLRQKVVAQLGKRLLAKVA